jgi:hypothetical protein
MPIVSIVGGPGTVASASGGKVKGFAALNVTPIVVAPANPQRRRIVFHNPGPQTVIFVAPSIDRDGLPLMPGPTNLGGCFAVFAGGFLTIEGECQTGWQGFAASGINNPFTVMDSNV